MYVVYGVLYVVYMHMYTYMRMYRVAVMRLDKGFAKDDLDDKLQFLSLLELDLSLSHKQNLLRRAGVDLVLQTGFRAVLSVLGLI